jgi:hypothetical protein
MKILQWCRLEDEHGRLSLTTLALLIGAALLPFGRPAIVFVAAIFLYVCKKFIAHWQTALAMEGAQEAGMAQLERQHTETVAVLQKRVDVLAAKVNEIELPRRDEALRRVTGSKA